MPLRPATDFPPTPKPEALETTYQECRAALVSANHARGGGWRLGPTGKEPMSPSIADLLEQTNRRLAGTDARVYRRVGEHLQRAGAALQSLQDAEKSESAATKALLGQGSFLQQSLANLRRLCKDDGIKGYSRLQKKALAKILELHGVTPPPPPLENFTKKQLLALVRQLLASP
jgi:hypothetical protein